MRIFYVVLIMTGILVLLLLMMHIRMAYAARKVKKTDKESKIQKLNAALEPFGFQYDARGDFICSGMYPWQREMGYCQAYDESAFAMYMVFDCEPIYFTYNGGRYLLEVWKGQYGCTTGAEIGLYVNRKDKDGPPEELFYDCVEDAECLPMSYALYKNGKKIQERSGIHWWLTGFNVGLFSEKSELAMEVGIGFPNMAMCSAFCEGLRKRGYTGRQIRVEQARVYFFFELPRSPQSKACGKCCTKRVMRRNRKNCKRYLRWSKGFDSTLDRITYIGYCFPILYRMLIRMGMKTSRRKLTRYQKRYQ